jgi:hypothetical protein
MNTERMQGKNGLAEQYGAIVRARQRLDGREDDQATVKTMAIISQQEEAIRAWFDEHETLDGFSIRFPQSRAKHVLSLILQHGFREAKLRYQEEERAKEETRAMMAYRGTLWSGGRVAHGPAPEEDSPYYENSRRALEEG